MGLANTRALIRLDIPSVDRKAVRTNWVENKAGHCPAFLILEGWSAKKRNKS
jgi:hypothetical protein